MVDSFSRVTYLLMFSRVFCAENKNERLSFPALRVKACRRFADKRQIMHPHTEPIRYLIAKPLYLTPIEYKLKKTTTTLLCY